MTHLVASLGDLADRYDALLCDIWGVVHDGRAAHAGDCAALARFRNERGPVVLLSNAPRSADAVIRLLDGFGVPREAYDGILTSGDVTRLEMERRGDAPFFHIGPERDHDVWEGLKSRPVPLADADFILCTGLFDDERETPDTYRQTLADARDRGLTMLCANPDIQVHRGPKLIWCAGALAQAYEAAGGAVTYFGKPHPPVYAESLVRIDALARRDIDSTRILAVGDGLKTDILGANRAGLDALFVTGGLHADRFGPTETPDHQKVVAELDAEEVFVVGYQPRLRW